MDQLEFYSEAYKQVAFISAVLGGFSVAFLGVLLVADDPRRLTGWTIGMSICASVAFVVATILGSFLVFTLPGVAARALDEPPVQLLTIASVAVVAFYIGTFSLLTSVALGGWLRSRAVGWWSTILAISAAAAILLAAFQLGNALYA